MDGHLIIFAVDVVLVVCSLLLAVGTLAHSPRNRNELLVAALLVGNVCAVVLGRYQYGFWIPEPYRIDVGAWEPLLNIGRNLSPGLLMLLCHSLFQDGGRLPRWLLALFVVQVLLEEPVHLVVGHDAEWRWLTEAAPGALEALFAGFATYWTVSGWTLDLVESRRRLRWLVLAFIGLLMVGSVLLLRVLIPQESIYNYYANVALVGLDAMVVGGIVLVVLSENGLRRYLSIDQVAAPSSVPPSAPDRSAAAAKVAELRRLLEEDCVYRQAGLSVSGLAEQIGLPEYRLRKLIHEELGYRNFNAFLHEYRIREACELLRDPEQRRTPILTIALTVGYQSINTFNRGFRAVVGVTPSEYRTGVDEDGADAET